MLALHERVDTGAGIAPAAGGDASARAVTTVSVRPLHEDDLDAADRVMRLAFGTFLGLPDPLAFLGDGDYVRSRFHANPDAAFAAEVGGRVAGVAFANRWGSFATVGPIAVAPALWNGGVASRLLDPICALVDGWGVGLSGLYTFAQSPLHIGLYQKYGFRPQALTLLLVRALGGRGPAPPWTRLSALDGAAATRALAACQHLAGAILPGLDPGREIATIAERALGDTLLVHDGDALAGFALCHCGAGSEAGSGACYLKFAAVAPGAGAPHRLSALLAACAEFARTEGAEVLRTGVNVARTAAYEQVLGEGFRIERSGVAMQRPNAPGLNRADAFVLDDWR